MKFIDKKYYNSWEVTGEIKIEEVEDFLTTYNFTIKEAEENFEEIAERLSKRNL